MTTSDLRGLGIFRVLLWAAVFGASVTVLTQSQPKSKTHRLEATPATVAYGYYDAAAKPVLRIASGDIIDVDTLLTNTPERLETRRRAADDDPAVAPGDRRRR